jgi:hypothetical protein
LGGKWNGAWRGRRGEERGVGGVCEEEKINGMGVREEVRGK